MAKEISEKTFEINITSELLNISKSFIYYMTKPFISNIMSQDEWFELLLKNNFYSIGLTQAEETNPITGGYDVSINYVDDDGCSGRLLFLQYKSGKRAGFCVNSNSQFHGSQSNKKPHIVFTFNDAANNTQHSTLRRLTSQATIKPESVLYVFPRITEHSEFLKSCSDIIKHTSFVPVLEIDRQGLAQTPPLPIIDGIPHKYRTSYDGMVSEVNYYYYSYYYRQAILSDLVAELVCIQFERFFIKVKNNPKIFTPELKYLIGNIKENLANNDNKFFKGIYMSNDKITDYLNQFDVNSLTLDDFIIPKAPQYYSTEIPSDGLILELDRDYNYSQINYQII